MNARTFSAPRAIDGWGAADGRGPRVGSGGLERCPGAQGFGIRAHFRSAATFARSPNDHPASTPEGESTVTRAGDDRDRPRLCASGRRRTMADLVDDEGGPERVGRGGV